MSGLRVLVCGGRHFCDRDLVDRTLDRLHKAQGVATVIEGNAPGADRIAGFWARKRRIDNLKFAAEWEAYGPAAGPMRNQRMIDEGKPDLVLAFPGGRGTADMISRAHASGIEVVEVAALSKASPSEKGE